MIELGRGELVDGSRVVLTGHRWRCAVCDGQFDLGDMELLEDDEQACLPCSRGGQVSGAGDLQPVVSPGTPAPDERIVA